MVTKIDIIFIWQLICGIIALGFTIAAFKRHLAKKTKMTQKLLLAFLFWTLSILFQAAGTYINYILGLENGPTMIGESGWFINWMICMVHQFQFSQLFTVIGTYSFYQFSTEIFTENNPKIMKIVHTVLMITCVLVYGIINPVFTNRELGQIFDISYFLVIYVVIVMLPIFINVRKLVRRVGKKEMIVNNLRSIYLTALIFSLSMVFFVIESLAPNGTNVFSFLAWIAVVGALLTGYLGFFKKPAKE